ncbi:LacI family DNA-binding transcriptional regulator [Porcincola intestinalis]|uniref:LacI family transcriptional regulator n=1 Tax=Porcincola intestinalis TaxID=2606632 RepID=A0A6L5X509_9FIRM|nr:LacI family DNA-binding transcriptional regulator [Porcincola intestinalis]MCI6766647.1 LacI family transcriptional regulator [Lachnospiraceae bacterium]MDD7060928.1 LacI family DNA-binding transcriptional regulator [Porcincola intestinalis]MDY5283358.1 LacI family DNA-binding transcriptional regulator [Porcincola intestinalis]MDY5578462.1 LacI family DNA-binding transcriptional regulator [Porcincola intestinalis]MSS14547.1 LacI family transcriptional regulator [Porcincola intestinalis]
MKLPSTDDKKITRKDIAEMAGVSVSVVSRALNNSGYVEQGKKQKILSLAKQYGYTPHPVAMTLQQVRSRQILFFCKDMQNPFNVDLYYGMIEAAQLRGYLVLFNAAINFDRIRDIMVDGIILQNDRLASIYAEQYGKNYFLPVVAASFGNQEKNAVSIPIVEFDMYEACIRAIEYLRKNGHRNIAYAGPYPRTDNNARSIAWQNTMRNVFKDRLYDYFYGIHYSELGPMEELKKFRADYMNPFSVEETYFEKGKIAANLIVQRNTDATAVICFNDEMAFGMIAQLQRMGVRVPDDISVVSFDCTNQRDAHYPTLTDIGVNPRYQGERLANLLIDKIERKKIAYISKLPIKVFPGDSVKNRNALV